MKNIEVKRLSMEMIESSVEIQDWLSQFNINDILNGKSCCAIYSLFHG
jgi:hypothetical protein